MNVIKRFNEKRRVLRNEWGWEKHKLSDWHHTCKYGQMIPINTVDTFLSGRYTDNAMLVKIDVEGAEFQVLTGAIDTLRRKRKPTWFLEICLDQFRPDSLNKNFLEPFRSIRQGTRG